MVRGVLVGLSEKGNMHGGRKGLPCCCVALLGDGLPSCRIALPREYQAFQEIASSPQHQARCLSITLFPSL